MSDAARESKSSDIHSLDKTTGAPHYAIHGGHTADIVSSVKSYLLEHPAKYCGKVESLLEMIYFRSTEYNPVENDRVRVCFRNLESRIHELNLPEGNENKLMDLIGRVCGEYERRAYIEGIKVGARLMMELMGEVDLKL